MTGIPLFPPTNNPATTSMFPPFFQISLAVYTFTPDMYHLFGHRVDKTAIQKFREGFWTPP